MAVPRPPAGKIVLTYDDYLRFPDDGRRYELLEGEAFMVPSPTPRHQRVLGNLFRIVEAHARTHGLGRVYVAPLDVVLSRTTVVQPDLVYLSRDRVSLAGRQNIAGAPDLVVEILSSSTAETDRTQKAQIYARHGVPHFWLVDPDEQVAEILELVEGTYESRDRLAGPATFSPSLFQGLIIGLGEVWD
jgi:Uma2 family endonuclease